MEARTSNGAVVDEAQFLTKRKQGDVEPPYPPFRMTNNAFALLKWDCILFGRIVDMDKYVHQLELGHAGLIA